MSADIFIVIIAIIVVICLAVAAWVAYNRRQLRATFGPEYDQVVQERGSTRGADRELLRRKHEHGKLNLQPISAEDRENYVTAWGHLQGSFIDDPAFALNSAEQLVGSVLQARGYPSGDSEEQLALLSVEHGERLTDYRAAQQVSRRLRNEDDTSGSGTASTEDMRQALLSYRALFNDLMATPGTETVPTTDAGPVRAWSTNSDESMDRKVEL